MFVRFLKIHFCEVFCKVLIFLKRIGIYKTKGVQFPHQCPVCKKYEFSEPFEDCPICNWCNDVVQEDHPDWEGCANNMSLNMALDAYSKGDRIH